MRHLSITLIAAASAVAFTQIASAADLPRKAPAYSPPPTLVYNWTGFYIGGNVGYSWSRLGNSLSVTNRTPGYFAAAVIPGVNASGTGGLDDNSFTGGLQLATTSSRDSSFMVSKATSTGCAMMRRMAERFHIRSVVEYTI